MEKPRAADGLPSSSGREHRRNVRRVPQQDVDRMLAPVGHQVGRLRPDRVLAVSTAVLDLGELRRQRILRVNTAGDSAEAGCLDRFAERGRGLRRPPRARALTAASAIGTNG